MENFEIREESIIVSVNPRIYPLDVIFSAAYVFTDKNYIILDGNPEEEILVQIKPKEKSNYREKIANDFNNELINYGAYALQAARNIHLRNAIIGRVLQTTGSSLSGLHSNTAGVTELSKDSKPWKNEKDNN